MDWITFHHPDISWPVIRRRASIELMELLELSSLFLSRGGWAVVNRSCYPNKAAYQNAVSRLRKSGLIVQRTDGAETPELILTNAGKQSIPSYFKPEQQWGKRWNGIWYLMMYDVPETDKKYRNTLRQFLKQKHMGNLQKSVWVTPHDIRPEFDDLIKAASLDEFAYLFEAKTVLGMPSNQVVEDAWNFDRINLLQERYCEVARQNIEQLKASEYSGEQLAVLARMATEAYHAAFMDDPLLPSSLLPANYVGKDVLKLHRRLFEMIADQLNALSSN